LEIASNDGVASNTATGSARIRTGNATAVGNHSNTHITQSANANLLGAGFIVPIQDAEVDNEGEATANSV
jgi:hypothetical protein